MNLGMTHLNTPATTGLSDEILARRLLDGDPCAGDALVHRYQQPLLRYLRRLAGSEHLADELHQATWLSVLQHLEKFQPSSGSGAFKAWLFRIATNKANDLWRSRGRERTARQALAPMTELAGPHAGVGLESTEQRQKLIRAIAQLPESQRVVLLLRYYSQMKFTDIAQMLGCPLNTALGRMHKAMIKLKELMEQ